MNKYYRNNFNGILETLMYRMPEKKSYILAKISEVLFYWALNVQQTELSLLE